MLLDGIQLRAQRLLRLFLQRGINRRENAQPLARRTVAAHDFQHLLVHEVGGVIFLMHRMLVLQHRLRLERNVVLLPRDPLQLQHPVQHAVPLPNARGVVPPRRELVRAAQQSAQHRRLAEIHLRRIFSEVTLRRRLRAKETVPEINAVQVQLEDLILRAMLLDLPRHEHLAQLALVRSVSRRELLWEGVAGELLRERARTLLVLACAVVFIHRAHHALHVHARVLVEARVLRRDHRLPKRQREMREIHLVAVLCENLAKQRTAPVQHDARGLHRSQPRVVELPRLRLVFPLHLVKNHGGHDRDDQQRAERNGEPPPEEPALFLSRQIQHEMDGHLRKSPPPRNPRVAAGWTEFARRAAWREKCSVLSAQFSVLSSQCSDSNCTTTEALAKPSEISTRRTRHQRALRFFESLRRGFARASTEN